MEAQSESHIDPFSRFIERTFFHLAGFCLLALLLVMLTGVGLRYLPLTRQAEHWIPGVLNLFQVWLVLFGSVAAVVSRHHLRITFFVDRLSDRMGRAVDLFMWLVRVATLGVVLYASYRVVETGFDVSIGGVPFTKGHIYVALPLVLVLMILLEIIKLRRNARQGSPLP
jgi:TRAP-type C4-dicarboxylate transport system permease small subunit